MIPDFRYSPEEILHFTYLDRQDLFLLTMKTPGNLTHTIQYQAPESNMFYVWLKAGRVVEAGTEVA